MTEDARNLLDQLHTERLEYNEYSLLCDALDGLEADRDKWKARAEMLERAIKGDCNNCVHSCEGFSCEDDYCDWQLDEARFKKGAEGRHRMKDTNCKRCGAKIEDAASQIPSMLGRLPFNITDYQLTAYRCEKCYQWNNLKRRKANKC